MIILLIDLVINLLIIVTSDKSQNCFDKSHVNPQILWPLNYNKFTVVQ